VAEVGVLTEVEELVEELEESTEEVAAEDRYEAEEPEMDIVVQNQAATRNRNAKNLPH